MVRSHQCSVRPGYIRRALPLLRPQHTRPWHCELAGAGTYHFPLYTALSHTAGSIGPRAHRAQRLLPASIFQVCCRVWICPRMQNISRLSLTSQPRIYIGSQSWTLERGPWTHDPAPRTVVRGGRQSLLYQLLHLCALAHHVAGPTSEENRRRRAGQPRVSCYHIAHTPAAAIRDVKS